MLGQKAILREQYADVFAEAPDGAETPSSALLSLDGSVESAVSLREYVATLAPDEPAEIEGVSSAVVGELDDLIVELKMSPQEPGKAFIGGLGALGVLSALDSFAVENCGESI